MTMSVPRNEFDEEAYVAMLQEILDQSFTFTTSRFRLGDRVMLGRLKEQLQYNGLPGEVIKSDDPARVAVRLHGRMLKVRPCNVFSADKLISRSSAPSWLPFYEHCSLQQEGLKGLGVMATRLLVKGTVLSDPSLCGNHVNAVVLAPSCEGRIWKRDNYLGDTRVGNVAIYHGGLQALYDNIEKVLVDEGYNCSHDERFENQLCMVGGCSYCGPSAMTVVASHGIQMRVFEQPNHHLNVGRYNFTEDNTMVFANLQPVDILYIVNGIAVALREVSLDDPVRAEFIKYAWNSVGVWITNGFVNLHSVDDMRALHDHTWPVVRRLHLEHLRAWAKWLQDVNEMESTSAAIDAQLRLVKARFDTTVGLVAQLETPEAPVLGSKKDVQSCNNYCVVELYAGPITRINGAIPDTADRVNVTMQHHMVSPAGQNPEYTRDTITTLTVTENIPAGSFLAVSYNAGLGQDSSQGYFKASEQPWQLSRRCRESARLRGLVTQILAECGPLLSAELTSHLEACALEP